MFFTIFKRCNIKLFSKVTTKRFLCTTKSENIFQFLKQEASYPIIATTKHNLAIKKTLPTKIPDHVVISDAKRDEFMAYFPAIVDELQTKTASLDNYNKGKYIREFMEHEMPKSNHSAGIMVAEIYKLLTPKTNQTQENLKLAYYLGWCTELILDSFNALDDILDRSEMRNGVPCWYIQNNLGNLAIVDGLLLQCGTYHILRKYFGHLDCYLQVIEVINEAIYRTHVGLRTDIKASEDTKFISTKIYQDIALNTTFYAACLMPVSLGLLLSGHKDLQALKKAESILTQQGLYYIIENDYFDCYGDPKVIKRLANDIQEGRCRWPAVVCMELASPEQKAIIKENYGKADPKCVSRIKQLYTDLNLPQIFEDYTVDLINRLERDIENTLDGDIKKVTLMLTEAISYSRHRGRPIY